MHAWMLPITHRDEGRSAWGVREGGVTVCW